MAKKLFLIIGKALQRLPAFDWECTNKYNKYPWLPFTQRTGRSMLSIQRYIWQEGGRGF
jgi:hypothetical protein